VASRAHTAEHSPVSPPSLPRCRRRQLLLRPPPATTVAFVRRRRTAHIYYTGFPLAPCQSAPKCDIKANPSLVARAHRGGSDTSNSSAPPRHGRLHQFHAASLAPRLKAQRQPYLYRSGCRRCFQHQLLRLHLRRPRAPLRRPRPLVLLLVHHDALSSNLEHTVMPRPPLISYAHSAL
jgi:hypothetical protein